MFQNELNGHLNKHLKGLSKDKSRKTFLDQNLHFSQKKLESHHHVGKLLF